MLHEKVGKHGTPLSGASKLIEQTFYTDNPILDQNITKIDKGNPEMFGNRKIWFNFVRKLLIC